MEKRMETTIMGHKGLGFRGLGLRFFKIKSSRFRV